jgi:hypothetical protein
VAGQLPLALLGGPAAAPSPPSDVAMQLALRGAAVDAFGPAAADAAVVHWNGANAARMFAAPPGMGQVVGDVQVTVAVRQGRFTRRVVVTARSGGSLDLELQRREGPQYRPQWVRLADATVRPDAAALREAAASLLLTGVRRAAPAAG